MNHCMAGAVRNGPSSVYDGVRCGASADGVDQQLEPEGHRRELGDDCRGTLPAGRVAADSDAGAVDG